MRAGQVARGAMVTSDASATVADAARALLAGEARVVVVTDGIRVVGILTERDIVARVVSRQLPTTTPVSTVMTPDPVTVSASASVAEVHAVLREHGFRRLPVMDEGRVVGLIELEDLDLADVTDEASPCLRRCPHCRTTQLRAVNNGETTNLLCLHCRACWHPVQGQLVRVDPEACPGCPDRAFCRFPAVGGEP